MTALTAEALPVLRLVPAPASAPPYDDEPGPAPRLRLVAPLPAAEPDSDTWAEAERTPASRLPGAKVFAHRLVQGVLEVAAGVRPVKQLRRDTTPELYETLASNLSGRPRTAGERPLRPILSLHVQERPEGVAEVCGTVQRGSRVVAVALRLEGMDGRWKCTELVGV